MFPLTVKPLDLFPCTSVQLIKTDIKSEQSSRVFDIGVRTGLEEMSIEMSEKTIEKRRYIRIC